MFFLGQIKRIRTDSIGITARLYRASCASDQQLCSTEAGYADLKNTRWFGALRFLGAQAASVDCTPFFKIQEITEMVVARQP